MKKFVTKASAFFVLMTIAPMVLAFILPANPTNYLLGYGIKNCREKVTHDISPRVLLIGASELAFGIDSRQMEDSLRMPVVNMGLHGGLGYDLVMRDALQKAKAGDICVVSIMAFDSKHGEGNGATLPFFIDLYPAKAALLNSRNIRVAMAGTYNMLIMKLAYLARSMMGVNAIDAEYNVSNFNSYGDEVRHLEDTVKRDIGTFTSFATDRIAIDYLDVFVGYLRELEQRGCRVIIMPGLLAEPSYLMAEDAYKDLEREFALRGFPYAVPQATISLPLDYFYNTNRHANAIGHKAYTLLMIDAIKRFR